MGENLYQVSHRVLSRCIVWSVLTVSATCAEAVAQEPSDDSQWTFDAAVYGWLMATHGTLGLKGFDADIDNSFSDTLKASDSLMAFMVKPGAMTSVSSWTSPMSISGMTMSRLAL